MKIAVILVNYNGLRDTLECIASIKKSSVKTSVFVVDNASSSDEITEIKRVYPDIISFRCEINTGFAGGNNVAIKKALEDGYDYILLLNNDTIIDSNMISCLLSSADEKTVALPNMYYYTSPQELWYGGGCVNRFLGKVTHWKKTRFSPFEVNFMTGCCALIHKSIFEKIGLLSEEYFMYCEDIDFSIRLSLAGIKMVVQPQAKLWHKVAKSSPSNGSAFRVYYNTKNRLLLVNKFREYFSVATIPYIKLSTYLKMVKAMIKKDETFAAFKNGIKDFYEQRNARK